jgi:hypothetical protein
VLLVTIIGAFVFTQGGALSVNEGTSPGVNQPQADRIASFVVENYSDDDERNVLRYGPNNTDVNTALSQDETTNGGQLEDLVDAAGTSVDSDRRTNPILNVSLVDGPTLGDGERTPAVDGGTTLAWGEYRRSEPVTSTRVVRLAGYDCDPVCWVVVRVW